MEIAQSIAQCELNLDIVKMIPGDLKNLTRINKRSFLIETDREKLILWIYSGQEVGLVFQNQLLRFCQQKDIHGLLYPEELTNGCFYGQLNEKEYYYLTKAISFDKISYRNKTQLSSIIELMCNFRKAMTDLGFFYLPEQKGKINIIIIMAEMLKNLNIFKMLAQFRLKPSYFDKLFLDNYQKIYDSIIKAHFMFEKSDYLTMFLTLTTQNIIINNYSRDNLRVNDNQSYFLHLKNCRNELPIIDLGALLVKAGRSNQWENSWFNEMIDEYQKYFKISKSELQILVAYLICPWELYRLISRYYYNRVNWSVTRFIHKLENYLNDEPYREDFLRQVIM